LISNYHQISKLSIIPKLFFKLISSNITNYCSLFLKIINNLTLYPCDNLALVKNIMLQSFECNVQTDIIYIDFVKEFSRINYDIFFFFCKLQSLGFSALCYGFILSILIVLYLLNTKIIYPWKSLRVLPRGSFILFAF